MFLILIIIAFLISPKMRGIAIFVQQILIEPIILKIVLLIRRSRIRDGHASDPEGMDEPFRLDHDLAADLHCMLVVLLH